jgi:hypothetical protein
MLTVDSKQRPNGPAYARTKTSLRPGAFVEEVNQIGIGPAARVERSVDPRRLSVTRRSARSRVGDGPGRRATAAAVLLAAVGLERLRSQLPGCP